MPKKPPLREPTSSKAEKGINKDKFPKLPPMKSSKKSNLSSHSAQDNKRIK